MLQLCPGCAALHYTKKKPYLTKYATQLFLQAMVITCHNFYNAPLAGYLSRTVKPSQMAQNAATYLVFNQLKRAHVILLIVLH